MAQLSKTSKTSSDKSLTQKQKKVKFPPKNLGYYILRAKIFENIAKESFYQLIMTKNFLKKEKEEMKVAYEGQIKELRERVEQRRVQRVEQEVVKGNLEEVKRLKEEVEGDREKMKRYRDLGVEKG